MIQDTKKRIEELLKLEPDLPKALERFSDDQAVRILTIHKSKGLEFDSVIILGVEDQTFWGNADEERCAFFVGVSRAKRRLVMTVASARRTPPSNPYTMARAKKPTRRISWLCHAVLESAAMKNQSHKPGWRRVKFGDVVRLSKARSQIRWPMALSAMSAWSTWSRAICAFAVGAMSPTA